jgi:YD repeat-containing protein
VEGAFDITGTATFKEHLGGPEGTIQLHIDGVFLGQKTYEGTNINWSFSEILGHMLDAGAYAHGEHSIWINAYAFNETLASAQGTFIIEVLIAEKNQGDCCGSICSLTSNPINFATGNKYQKEIDLVLSGPDLPMGYTRYYNSQSEQNGSLGYGWTGTFSENLTVAADKIILRQADGREVHFLDNGQGKYISEADHVREIEPVTGGHQLTEPDARVLTFDNEGKLTQITDRNGNTQSLTYDNGKLIYLEDNYGRRMDFAYSPEGRLTTLTTPGGEFTYTYDALGNLTSVTNPATTGKTYLYEDPNDPHNLTGIINERGVGSGTYAYDGQDRAVVSEGADGTSRVEVAYEDNFVRSVNNSLGKTSTFELQVAHGMGRVKSASGAGCDSCPATSGVEYDLDNRLLIQSATDANGNVTSYTYDDRGNVLTKTEAAGSPEERTTTYTYHPDYNLITSITRDSTSNPGETTVTSFTYDASGNLLEKTETGYSGGDPVTRTTTNTYNGLGQITMIDGPRTDVADVTTFEYYPNDPSEGLNRGMLKKITDALGGETLFSQYNAFGKPEQSIDANGVVTTYVYDAAGRLTSRTTAGHTTSFDYDGAGNLTAVYLPNGSSIT